MSTIALETTVGRLVAEQPGRSQVFERIGVDYCCGGRRSLAEACREKSLDPQTVVDALAQADSGAPVDERDWLAAPLGELADHIEATHHAYLREALPRLSMLTENVAAAHGERDVRLGELRDVFAGFRAELESHMAKEELILFPLCRRLDGAAVRPRFHCATVANPIAVMRAEHDEAGDALEAMRRLTDVYRPPSGACNTYKAMLQALEELEADMHRHVHLENNVLFPRAEAAEQSLPPAS